MMEIRPAKSKDKAEWLRMRMTLWPNFSRKQHLAEMTEFEGNQALAVFVAVRYEGGLGGFLEVSIRPFADGCDTQPVGYIEGWYVDPDLRRQGIGRRLVEAAEAWAVEQGCREMASDCVIDNKIGLQAHLALGYVETARLIHFKKPLLVGQVIQSDG